jgi:retron-type reverse transcriptase
MMRGVNRVLDIDIRNFFDIVDHGWSMRMRAHRIADWRVLRLVERRLGAGVLDGGQWKAAETGTPQGSGMSPILTNLFLHHVVDLRGHQSNPSHLSQRTKKREWQMTADHKRDRNAHTQRYSLRRAQNNPCRDLNGRATRISSRPRATQLTVEGASATLFACDRATPRRRIADSDCWRRRT